MTSDDQYIAMLATLLWPVRAAFDTCPVSSALWCVALGGAPPHPDDLELAARFVDQRQQLEGYRRAPS